MTTVRLRRRGASALALLGVLVLTAACSANPPATALPGARVTPGASSTAGPALDRDDALLKFAQCMRDHGVDVPDPVDGNLSVNGNGLTEEQMKAADDACAKWQQMAEPQDGGRELTEDEKQAFLDQAKCMRDRGWNVPDPVFDGGRVTQHVERGATAAPGDPKPGDPQFDKDSQQCAKQAGIKPPENSGAGTQQQDGK